jgi:hypothetical protein
MLTAAAGVVVLAAYAASRRSGRLRGDGLVACGLWVAVAACAVMSFYLT